MKIKERCERNTHKNEPEQKGQELSLTCLHAEWATSQGLHHTFLLQRCVSVCVCMCVYFCINNSTDLFRALMLQTLKNNPPLSSSTRDVIYMIINISTKTAFLLLGGIFRVTSTKLNRCHKSRSANEDIKIQKKNSTQLYSYSGQLITVIVEALYIAYD